MERATLSSGNLRLLLLMVLATLALYIWAFGFRERMAHFDFIVERQTQKQPIPASSIKNPEPSSTQSLAPKQMPPGLYPAFLASQQTDQAINYTIAQTRDGLEARNT